MNQLGNEFVSLSIDETGALTELCNRKSGRNLVCPHSLVRLILGDSGCLELEAVPAGVPDIRCGEDRITLVFSEVECKASRHDSNFCIAVGGIGWR